MISIDWVSGLIFVIALGLMIFLHELGHFLASRFFGIEVEEFGFGLPPRIAGLGRGSGYLLVNGQRVEIPRNFDRGFDWQRLVNKPATLSVDSGGDSLVLRGVEVGEVTEAYAPSTSLKLGSLTGSQKINGVVSEVHPGTLLSLNWLPIGGFVRPKGENDPNVPGGLASASPWKRLFVLVAGPAMNLLTAVVIYAIIFSQVGVPDTNRLMVASVSPNSPAAE